MASENQVRAQCIQIALELVGRKLSDEALAVVVVKTSGIPIRDLQLGLDWIVDRGDRCIEVVPAIRSAVNRAVSDRIERTLSRIEKPPVESPAELVAIAESIERKSREVLSPRLRGAWDQLARIFKRRAAEVLAETSAANAPEKKR